VNGLDLTTRPALGQQPGGRDIADVSRVDPRLGVVEGHRQAEHALADRIEFPEQVGEKVPAAQVQHCRARGVELLLGPGQPVDLARSGPHLRPDAAEEDRAANAVLRHGAGRIGAQHGVPGDRVSAGVSRGRLHPEQRIRIPGRLYDGPAVHQVGLHHVCALGRGRVKPSGVTGQQRGPDTGLDEQPHDSRSDVPSRRGDNDLHATLPTTDL
jgi:hypothetical protein